MRVLLANLKHFYQCRVVWLLYLLIGVNLLFLGGLGSLMHSIRHTAGGAEGLSFRWMGVVWALSLVAGVIVASLQMEVISKPFSFCLPGHRIVLRQLVLLAGLVLGLLVLSLEFVKGSPTSLSPVYLFGGSLVAYFGGVSVGLMSPYGLAVALCTILVLLMGGTMLDLARSREFVGTTVPALVAIVLGAGSAVAVWQWLGRTDLFRRRCGKPWLGFSESWNPAAREKYRLARASAKGSHRPCSRANELLLRAMKDCAQGSVAQHVWGALYMWMLPGGGGRSRIGSMGLLGLGSAVMAWWMPAMGPFFIANVSLCSGLAIPNLPVSSPAVIAGGRRERFFATMALTTALGAIVTCCLVLGSIAADSLEVHSPMSEAYEGYSDSYVAAVATQPMSLRVVVLFTALFPLGCLLDIRLLGRRTLARGAPPLLLLPIALFGQLVRPLLAAIPPVCVAFVFLLSWVVGLYGVHRIIMRSDLVRK